MTVAENTTQAGAIPAPEPPRTAVAGREDFTASLESFQGPLDLLLYLIRETEVEITDIPIARILEQYMRFIEQAAQMDLQTAGEFLVMAATLMEIKSRELLPVPPEAADEEIIEDPRSELVRQLLQYRCLKDQATALSTLADAWQMCRPRGLYDEIPELPAETAAEDQETARATVRDALVDVDLYALYAAYERLAKAILSQVPKNIAADKETIEQKIERIEHVLKVRPFAHFSELIADLSSRPEIAATFVALLELVRRRAIKLIQQQDYAAFNVEVMKEGEAEEISRREAAAAEAVAETAIKAKAEQDALLAAQAQAQAEAGRPAFIKRRPPRPHFKGLVRPEDVEEIDAEESEISRRVDAILAAADAISERFEQAHAQSFSLQSMTEPGAEAPPPAGETPAPPPPAPPTAAADAPDAPKGPDGAGATPPAAPPPAPA
jgi:segregation and condensation protein A